MRNTKYRAETLALYDYKSVEEHLTAMADRGWRLESIGSRFWKYRRAEPARVRYAVTYVQDASQFNPGPTEGQQSLEELCAAAGWSKVTDWFQMQIYCSEAKDPIPLETEESVRLKAVHQSMKRNYLPGNIISLLLSLVMLGVFVHRLIADPIHILGNSSRLFIGPLLLLLTVILSASLARYWLWYRRSARSVARGGSCAVPGNIRRLNQAAHALLILWTALYLLTELTRGQPRLALYFLLHLLAISLMVVLLRRVTALFRRWKLSWGENLFLTLTAAVLLAAALTYGPAAAAIRGGWLDWHSGASYTYGGETWDVSPADIPLTVSDLTGQEYSHIRRQTSRSGSVFLPRQIFSEVVLDGAVRTGLRYEITVPRSWLYDLAVESAAAPREESVSIHGREISWAYTWEEIPAAPWGAERACRELIDGRPTGTVLLIFPDQLAELNFSPAITPEQAAAAGEALKNASCF